MATKRRMVLRYYGMMIDRHIALSIRRNTSCGILRKSKNDDETLLQRHLQKSKIIITFISVSIKNKKTSEMVVDFFLSLKFSLPWYLFM